MRRLFFFLLLGILMCAGGINKSEPKKCKEQNVSVDPLDLYRAPGPSVTFEPDLWEHRDERWGAWRDRNTPPTNTRARARRLSGMIVSVPIGWMVDILRNHSIKAERERVSGPRSFRVPHPLFLDQLEILSDSSTWRQRCTFSI